jgi:hypothetical protein
MAFIRYFHGCYSLADDQLWGVTRRRKGGDHTLAALKSIRAARTDGAPISVIMDNLSANKTPPIRSWAKKSKAQLCLTPTSASWANPAEAQFGPLRTFIMGGSDHPNHQVLDECDMLLQQSQRPPRTPRRRLRAGQRDQLGLDLTGHRRGHRRELAFFPPDRGVRPTKLVSGRPVKPRIPPLPPRANHRRR